jgi:hypothetical protein
MKGILGVLLFEVSILNYVIHKDLFRGHLVGPCGNLKCIGGYIMDHGLYFPQLLVVVIVIIMVMCLLDSVVRKLCYYC